MSGLRRMAARGLKRGDRFKIVRTFSEQDTHVFGDITRDYNPVHYDKGFAASRGFPRLICHGLLTGSMICEIGGQLGWLASQMDFRFLRPVYFGDTITCELTLTELDSNGKAGANAVFSNQHGEVVLTAVLGGYLPDDAAKGELNRMMAQGDPTNPLA